MWNNQLVTTCRAPAEMWGFFLSIRISPGATVNIVWQKYSARPDQVNIVWQNTYYNLPNNIGGSCSSSSRCSRSTQDDVPEVPEVPDVPAKLNVVWQNTYYNLPNNIGAVDTGRYSC